MANTKSAKKMTRKIAKRTVINRSRRSRMRTFVRKVEEAIAAGDRTVAPRRCAQPSPRSCAPPRRASCTGTPPRGRSRASPRGSARSAPEPGSHGRPRRPARPQAGLPLWPARHVRASFALTIGPGSGVGSPMVLFSARSDFELHRQRFRRQADPRGRAERRIPANRAGGESAAASGPGERRGRQIVTKLLNSSAPYPRSLRPSLGCIRGPERTRGASRYSFLLRGPKRPV